jgi:hypothetical protein
VLKGSPWSDSKAASYTEDRLGPLCQLPLTGVAPDRYHHVDLRRREIAETTCDLTAY